MSTMRFAAVALTAAIAIGLAAGKASNPPSRVVPDRCAAQSNAYEAARKAAIAIDFRTHEREWIAAQDAFEKATKKFHECHMDIRFDQKIETMNSINKWNNPNG